MPKRPASIADLPESVPVFPLSAALLLPQTNKPLKVFETRFIDLIDTILGGDRLLALVQPEKAGEEAPDNAARLHETACIGRLVHFEETGENQYLVVVEGICRTKLTEEIESKELFRRFKINSGSFSSDFDPKSGEEDVDRKRFMDVMRAYADFADIDVDWEELDQTETADLVNLCCMLSPYGVLEKQMLLEAETLVARAETLIALTEIEIMRAETGITLQ